MRKRSIYLIIALALGALLLGACNMGTDNGTAGQVQQTESKVSAQSLSRLNKAQPVHEYGYSQIRQNGIDVEDMQAKGVQTTSFDFLEGIGLIDSCPSIGFPFHSTDELTNPEQITWDNGDHNGGNVTTPQADPTGVYAGNSSGTYIKCIGADGKPYYDYFEGYVKVVTGPAHYDAKAKQIVLDGPSSFVSSTGK